MLMMTEKHVTHIRHILQRRQRRQARPARTARPARQARQVRQTRQINKTSETSETRKASKTSKTSLPERRIIYHRYATEIMLSSDDAWNIIVQHIVGWKMTLSLSMFVDRIIICRHKHGDMQFSRNGKKERKKKRKKER
jgi:hypothetical protein